MQLKNYSSLVSVPTSVVAQAPSGYHLSVVGGYITNLLSEETTVDIGVRDSGGVLKFTLPFVLAANEQMDLTTKMFLQPLETVIVSSTVSNSASVVLFGAETPVDIDNVPDAWTWAGLHDVTTSYLPNNIVRTISGDCYICRIGNKNSVPPSANWEVFSLAGRGISTVIRTSGDGSGGTTDTYTITFSDNSTSTFFVYNGANGVAITDVVLVSGDHAAGTTDTYAVNFSDGSFTNFTVYNGANGEGVGDMLASVYDKTASGTVDDSKLVNGLTVETAVPAGAVFTDTETTTSISISSNILTYVDEVGTSTNIDLSLYLDDTNLARLTSGVLDGSTGIATFSRDDETTFTIDLSALLDNTNVTVNNTLTSTSTVEALSAAQGKALQDGKVDNARVLTDVPVGAVFIDTVYDKPANEPISYITDLQAILDGKVDGSQVLTDVPAGAVFIDTVYDDTDVVKAPLGVLPALDGSQLTNMPVALPDQAGFAGKYLKTDGTNATWESASTGNELSDNPLLETPSITYPIEGEVGTSVQPVVTSSAFNPLDPTDTLAAVFFRFRAGGVTVHTSPKLLTTTYTPEAGVLEGGVEYDVSVLYVGNFSGQTAWAVPVRFTTMPITIDKPVIEDPLDNAVEVAEQPVFRISEFNDLSGVAVFDKAVFIVRDSEGTVIHTSPEQSGYTYALPAGIIEEGGLTYTVEGYLKSVGHGVSETTEPVTFTTMLAFSSPYGLQWDSTKAVGGYTRLGDPYYTAVQSRMKRCVLLADGTVNYYLDPTDSTKKEDGSLADLTGASGNVMVEIPKFYVKYDNTPGAKEMWVSEKPEDGFEIHPAFIKNGVEVDYRYYRAYKGSVSGTKLISRSGVSAAGNETITAFRTKARANGAGWGLIDWHLVHAVQTLLFIEIGTFDSQSILGNGNDTGSDYGMTTGGSNSIGNASSPSTNDDTWMSYRGIENFYAVIFEWVDGINVSDRLVYVSNTESTFSSDVFSGDYVSTGVTLPSTNDYIKDMDFSINGFIPTVSGGSDSTYVPDYVYSGAGARVVAFGGVAGHGLGCGAAFLAASYAVSISGAYIGAGLSF